MERAPTFEYSNLSGRPPGRFVALLSRVSRGVRAVQQQVEPYAREWERRNAAAVEQVAAGERWWAVLGDSMSQGIGASTPGHGWVGLLAPRLGLPVVNLSFNGARIDDVLERQLGAMDDLALRAGNPPAVVTLMIGNNDMNSSRFRAQIPAAMTALLQRVPRGTVVATQPGAHGSALAVNRAVDEAHEAGRIRVAEFRIPDMRSWKGRLASDHFHPNDAGYAAMAGIMGHPLGL